jgi:hypothetical protein
LEDNPALQEVKDLALQVVHQTRVVNPATKVVKVLKISPAIKATYKIKNQALKVANFSLKRILMQTNQNNKLAMTALRMINPAHPNRSLV